MKKIVSAIVFALLISIISISVNVSASEVDQTLVKSVQTVLNFWGYDCGTPDGIAGAHTKEAVTQYQRDQGIEETGEITYDLISRMTNGVPYNVFERRYNEMVDYLNTMTSQTHATYMNHISINLDTEKYTPDNIFDIYINPNYTDKTMIGLINIGSTNGSSYTETEFATALAEYYATIYAFDPSITTLSEALDKATQILDNVGENNFNSITYSNYSGSGMFLVKGEYDEYVGMDVESNVDVEKDIYSSTSENLISINNLNELENLTSMLGSSLDSIANSNSKLNFKTPYEVGKYASHYGKFSGTFLGYNGSYSFSFNNGLIPELGHFTFTFDDQYRTTDPYKVINEINSLLMIGPSDESSRNRIWFKDGYKADFLFSEINTKELYSGPLNIAFWKLEK